MRIKVISVPVVGGEHQEEELNSFLANHAVVEVERQLIQSGNAAYWSFCIHYVTDHKRRPPSSTAKKKVDYMEVLSAEEFKRFSLLRKLRKEWATKEEVSNFIVFSDEQLAGISKLAEVSKASLAKVAGIGEKKLAKYGDLVIEALGKLNSEDEKGRESDA